VAFYINGTLATTLTGGPTTATGMLVGLEALNGIDASNTRFQISPVMIKRA